MKKNYSLFSITKIFLLAFLFIVSCQVKSQTYPFSGNGGNIALWGPINWCGDGSAIGNEQYNAEASVYPSSGFNGGNPFGNINSVAWYCNGGSGSIGQSGLTNFPMKIYMKSVGAATTLSATTYASEISGATLVYSGNETVIIPVGSYHTITLCNTFNWTSGNLEVIVECDWPTIPECGTSANWEYNTVANTDEYWGNGTSVANLMTLTGSISQYRPDIEISLGAAGGSGPVANAGGNQTICQGQHTTLNGSGSGSYNWSPSTGLSNPNISNPVATPTTTTTYTLTTSNSCGTATDIATVSVSPLPTVNAGPDATICNGNSTTLNGSGGGPYVWSPAGTLTNANISNPVANPTITTTYTLSATNGCGTVTDIAIVHVNNLPAANAGGDKTICSGNSATLTASGGGTYAWNTGPTTASITVSPTAPTTYTVTVTNSCGSSTDIATVNVTALPAAAISGNTSICPGSSVTLTASGGGTYVWNTGATSASITDSPTTNTTYTVTVSNGLCSTFTTASVNMLPPPSAGISGNTNICLGDASTLSATGGGNYVWNTAATTAGITVNPTTSTPYTVTVTDANGCTAAATATVNVAPPPTASIAGNNTVCSGSATALTASGGLTYSWNTGATTSVINISPTASNSYTVIVSAGTCSDTTSISVTVNPLPAANISGNTSVCSGSSTTLTATGGGTYSWNTGATSASISDSPTTNTAYTVTVTNANGCTATATATVVMTPPPVANVSNTTICSGQSAILTASGGTSYSWSTNQTTNPISVSPTTSTIYFVIVSNGNCADTANAIVTVNPNPIAGSGADVTITYGNSTTLSATGGGNYSWSNGSLTQTISVSPTATTDYCVFVANANGCVDSSCVTVFVEIDCGDFFVPSAFSPNNDGKNDVFYVRSKCLKTMNLVIYDRWGTKVFATEDINQGWDGTLNGKIFNSAVFFYTLNYELLSGETGTKKGNISLVK